MDLAPPPGLVVVLLAAAIVWGLGLAAPRGVRTPLAWTGGAVAGLAAVATALYVALGLSMAAWREHPQEARIAAFVGIALLGLQSLYLLRRAHGEEEGHDGDGGGGQRRPRPSPPRRPGPTAPTPVGPSWPDFDAARSEWERTPAGVR